MGVEIGLVEKEEENLVSYHGKVKNEA